MMAASGLLRTAAQGAGAAVTVASNSDIVDYQVGVLLRSADAKQPLPAETRDELAGIVTRSIANGRISEPDRTYLTDVVAQRAGLTREEAAKRVEASYAEASRLAREAADNTRRAAATAGFVTAVSLMVSLAAAWWAAIKGGDHRDTNRPARFGPALLFRR